MFKYIIDRLLFKITFSKGFNWNIKYQGIIGAMGGCLIQFINSIQVDVYFLIAKCTCLQVNTKNVYWTIVYKELHRRHNEIETSRHRQKTKAHFHRAAKHKDLLSMKFLPWWKQDYQPNFHVIFFWLSKQQLNTSNKQYAKKWKFGW